MTEQRKWRLAFLLLLAAGTTALFLRMIQGFVLTLLMAAILAGLARPTYQRVLEAFGGRKSLAAGTTLVLGIVLVVAPFMGLMTIVAQEAAEVSSSVQHWMDQQLEQGAGWQQRLESIPLVEQLAPYQDRVMAKASELGGKIATVAMSNLAAGTRGTARFFLLLFVLLYAMFYFLQEGRQILDRALHYVPLSVEEKGRMLATFTTVTRATLKGTGIIGFVQGALGGAAFAIAGITGPVFWGLMMAVMSVLPGIGPAIIWVPAVVYLAVEGRTAAAIGVGLWCFAVVSTVDNLLRPRLVGKDTEMPDLLVLLGTLGGLVMFGAVGIVVGPIIAAIFVTVWEILGSAIDETRTREQLTANETAP